MPRKKLMLGVTLIMMITTFYLYKLVDQNKKLHFQPKEVDQTQLGQQPQEVPVISEQLELNTSEDPQREQNEQSEELVSSEQNGIVIEKDSDTDVAVRKIPILIQGKHGEKNLGNNENLPPLMDQKEFLKAIKEAGIPIDQLEDEI
ncbi:uncharacterized protein LOC141904749 [Tubulanus polymorphus]|uniref:uncharacterized protein LOC141904749 n=1 Tax=Tubulanus polymorphus TaxID=672921 RepID=UPI003DA59C45